jgi:hypothetical protein
MPPEMDSDRRIETTTAEDEMPEFPRTTVGGVSLPRLLVGTNWFMGYSHQTRAKDQFIKAYQTRENIADTLTVFFENGINAIMGMPVPMLHEAIQIAEDRTGREGIRILTPSMDLTPDGPADGAPERAFDSAREMGATFCFPHQSVTDRLLDPLRLEIRHMERLSKLIREREMIPGLSTHAPQSVIAADRNDYDVATYIQLFNAAGFLMHVEIDWVARLIRDAKKPVMTIKPFAAGRVQPIVGLTFSWNTIRDCDMVTVGTQTAGEAREVVELSFDILARRASDIELQTTRSKQTLAPVTGG